MLKGPPHVGRSNIAVPSIYKEVHGLGHDETFQFIAEKVDEVNPGSKYGDHVTPLFIANQKNHFGIFQIIQEKLRNAKVRFFSHPVTRSSVD